METPVDNILKRLEKVRQTPTGFTARCPAHQDVSPSLSISLGDDGRVLVHCHAGCPLDSVLAALGLAASDLFPKTVGSGACGPPRPPGNIQSWPTADAAISAMERSRGRCTNRWTYLNAAGERVGMVLRWDLPKGKEIRPLAVVSGAWRISAMAAPRPLYELASLTGNPDVFVAEGEKAVDAIKALGLYATTSAGGAEAASRTDWTPLRGHSVTILPDADDPGRKYAQDVAEILLRLNPPATVKILELPGLRPQSGDDAVEFIAARRAAGIDNATLRVELEKLAKAAPVREPSVVGSINDPVAWDMPEPLGRFNLPEFPMNSLRREFCPLWQLCAAVAESFQVPVDLPAMLGLGVAGAALAKHCEVHVRADWWEPLVLHVVVVLESGERKSAVFRVTTEPLTLFEREECERLAPEIERNSSELRILAAAVKTAENEAGRQKDAAKREEARRRAHELAEQLRNTPTLAAPRLLADDATPEALAKLLHQQGGRIALVSPEGGVFEQMAGRYSDGVPNLDVYLKGHAGDDIRIDRVSRPPEFVRQPALTVVLAVQPEVVRGLADKPGLRGRGVLARVLYSLPVSRVGYRELNPAAVPPSVSAAYNRMIRDALALDPLIDTNGAPTPHIIRLSTDALSVLDNFRAEVEKSMREGGDLAGARDWALKLPGAVVRIAGILHGLEHAGRGRPGSVPLSGEAMAEAITIGRYLIEHAKAAFFEMGADPSIGLARRLLKWIEKSKVQTFTRRDAFRNLRGSIKTVSGVDRPLEVLTEHGYIRQVLVKREGAGRAPSPLYEVNPLAYGHNGHNGQNSVVEGDSGQSVHSVPDIQPAYQAPTPVIRGDRMPLHPSDANDVTVGEQPVQDIDDQLAEDASAAAEILGETLPGVIPTNRGPWQ